jgi:hypothetical protein
MNNRQGLDIKQDRQRFLGQLKLPPEIFDLSKHRCGTPKSFLGRVVRHGRDSSGCHSHLSSHRRAIPSAKKVAYLHPSTLRSPTVSHE